MANAVRRVLSFDIVDALTVAVVILTVQAWASAIARRGFDYDELEHAYAIWCIKLGLRPYRDFFECHPLFLWYPLSLLFKLVGDSYAILFVCRVLTGLGHVAFFIGLGKNTALSSATGWHTRSES